MQDKDNFAIYYVVRFRKRIIDLEIINFQLFITCLSAVKYSNALNRKSLDD